MAAAENAIVQSAVQQVLHPSLHSSFRFSFDRHLQRDYGYRVEKKKPCALFQQGQCPNGDNCPDSHQTKNHYNNLVCKHWLRGLCKKGVQCEFLHEYNLREMPECVQWNRFLSCSNGNECLYLHVDPMLKLPPCPHYERGFCPLGPRCGAQHVKRTKLCKYYMGGFCPNGKECSEGAHPKWQETKDMAPPQPKVIPQDEDEEEQERARLLARLQEEGKREFGGDADRDGRSFDRQFGGGGRGGRGGAGGGRGGRGWKQGGKRMERY